MPLHGASRRLHYLLDKAIERSPGRKGIRSICVQPATHSRNLSSKLRACCSDATRSYPDETCYKALSGLNVGTIGRSQIIRSYSQLFRTSTATADRGLADWSQVSAGPW